MFYLIYLFVFYLIISFGFHKNFLFSLFFLQMYGNMTITVISSGGLNTTKNVSLRVIPKIVLSSTAAIEINFPTQPVILEEDALWGLKSIYLTINKGNEILEQEFEDKNNIGIKSRKENSRNKLEKKKSARRMREIEKDSEGKSDKVEREKKEIEQEEKEEEDEEENNKNTVFEIFIVPEKGNLRMLVQQDEVVTYSVGSVRLNIFF